MKWESEWVPNPEMHQNVMVLPAVNTEPLHQVVCSRFCVFLLTYTQAQIKQIHKVLGGGKYLTKTLVLHDTLGFTQNKRLIIDIMMEPLLSQKNNRPNVSVVLKVKCVRFRWKGIYWQKVNIK